MKKILGITAVTMLVMGQISFSASTNTDAAVQRLVRIAKQREAKQAKEARSNSASEPKSTNQAGHQKSSKNKEAKNLKAKKRNETESEMMNAEIQRIKKKRVDQINNNIEKFHKTNEMLDQMEQRLDTIQNRIN